MQQLSTGGSGGGAHAAMLAATSDNPDYYAYEAKAGAVGVYQEDDGYTTTVTIDGEEVELSDGMWGCMPYSAITSLADAAAYRTFGAAKSIPGFDVMDYGQEDYVFGSTTADARHWDKYVLRVMEESAGTLTGLFNQSEE